MSCIKVRKSASRFGWKKGNILRNLSVLAQKNDLQKWKYGKLWIEVDCRNSILSLKRIFGEYVYSVKLKNMIQEMISKASPYNKMISI